MSMNVEERTWLYFQKIKSQNYSSVRDCNRFNAVGDKTHIFCEFKFRFFPSGDWK